MNVLLVEDNDVDIEAVRRAFSRLPDRPNLHVARDGLDALERLRAATVPRPYLVLLDLNMPRMGGLEFLGELRADDLLTDSVVFVLTTSRDPEDRDASYRRHVAGYVVKSDLGRDFSSLNDLLASYRHVVELPGEAP